MLYRYLAPHLGEGPMEIDNEAAAAAQEVLEAEQADDTDPAAPDAADTSGTSTRAAADEASGRALSKSI
jgi:hypothetical protein